MLREKARGGGGGCGVEVRHRGASHPRRTRSSSVEPLTPPATHPTPLCYLRVHALAPMSFYYPHISSSENKNQKKKV